MMLHAAHSIAGAGMLPAFKVLSGLSGLTGSTFACEPYCKCAAGLGNIVENECC
jgi:hypothetical protein